MSDPGPLTGSNDEQRRGLFAELVKRIKAHGITSIVCSCEIDLFLAGPIPAQGLEGSWRCHGYGPQVGDTDEVYGRTGEEAFRALATLLEEPK